MTDQIANIQQLKKAFDCLQDKPSEEEQAVADDTHARNG